MSEQNDVRFTMASYKDQLFHWSRQTKLIWHPDHVEVHFEQPVNAYCMFRKTFELPHVTQLAAAIDIFADSRYMLFVNGSYVGRGPGRADPRWQTVDQHALTGLLHQGTNVIAVLALHYGYGTGQYIHRIPALAAQISLSVTEMTDSTQEIGIGTDESWLCRLGDAYDGEAPRLNGCQGAMEVVDARKLLTGWTKAEFDVAEGEWIAAKGRNTTHTPFWNWVPRDIPLLEEGLREVQAVVNQGTVTECPWPLSQLHHQLLAEEKAVTITERKRTALTAAKSVVVPLSAPGSAAVLTCDFGLIDAGYLQLEATGPAGTVIDVIYAEELYEDKVWLDLRKNRAADRFILSGGRDRFEVAFGWKAWRYVQLRVRNSHGEVRLHRLAMRTRKYALEQTAHFASSDRLLDDIWSISAHTLRLCMQDGFLDSSSREQQQWMGDGRIQAIYNAYYSGDARLHRKMLREFGQSQDWMGMTAQRYPDGHHNYPPIPSFCLAWICSFADYGRYTGDRSLLGQWWNQLVMAIRWFTAWENSDGLLEDVPYWMFIDWGEGPSGAKLDVNRKGIIAVLNLQYVEALQCMARMAEHMGDVQAQQVYERKHRQLAAQIASQLWDERAQAYPDCKVNGTFSKVISEPAQALALLHLHEPGSERAKLLIEHSFTTASAATGASEVAVVKGSPFFMLMVLRALNRHGYRRLALDLVRERYGPMIAAGATAVWEKWKVYYKDDSGHLGYGSASHAWGAAMIVMAVEGVFGVRMLTDGWKQFRMEPDDLLGLERASISFPAGGGFVQASAERAERSVKLTVTIPAGCEGEVCGRTLGAGEHLLVYDV